MAALAAAMGLSLSAAAATDGPYSLALDDPNNPFDAPIPAYIGPDGLGLSPIEDALPDPPLLDPDSRNFLNPVFFGWATDWEDYHRSDSGTQFDWPDDALGPATGDNWAVVSLGDLTAEEVANGQEPGRITLLFERSIANLPGADFAVFENGFISQDNLGGAGIGGIFGELAYVEVSSDGTNFARFPSVSLTPESVGPFGSINPTHVFNLAGKHVNSGRKSWGTPFDLEDLADDPLVLSGAVDLSAITHIRIVDIPGTGQFKDSLDNPIFDAHPTIGSGGFDLEAIGAISMPVTFAEWETIKGIPPALRGTHADASGNGIANLLEAVLGRDPLTPEHGPATTLQFHPGESASPGLSFSRDTRLADVVVEVQAATASMSDWLPAARAVGTAPLEIMPPFSATLEDESASEIRSIGVIRDIRLLDVTGHPDGEVRFLRLKAEVIPEDES